MKAFALSLLLLTGCFLHQTATSGGVDQLIVHASSVPRQKQKIALLHKKLASAEKSQQKANEEVETLQKEVNKAEISLILALVDSYEQQMRKFQLDPHKYAHLLQIESSTLFLRERETLHHMIQSGPSPSSFEAQVVLDRILRVITELGDDAVR